MRYTQKEVAKLHGYGEMQTSRHIAQLIKEKKFKKRSIGKYYTDEELEKLAKLLGFSLPEKK